MPNRDAIRPTVCAIDLDALRANARLVSRYAQAPVAAVVKADAYGHGALPVVQALAPLPEIRGFAVNLVEEAVYLRDRGIGDSLLVMGPSLAGGYDEIVGLELTPMVSAHADLEGLHRAAERQARPLSIHLFIDTGMGRLGFLPGDGPELSARLASLGNLRVTGLATHFACADVDDPTDPDSLTRRQLARFADARQQYWRSLIDAGVCSPDDSLVQHVANSAAALHFAGTGCDFVRAGLALYGNGRGPSDSELGQLRPVMTLQTQVAQVRTVAPGASVSYGALFRAARTTSVAVLPLGYADGVPRRVTGRAEVAINGHRYSTIGAITMGMIMVDVTDAPEPVRVGDAALVFGECDGAHISVAEFADWAGCIEYEVTCGIGRRVPRVYKGLS